MTNLGIKIINTNAGTNDFVFGALESDEWVTRVPGDLRAIINPFVQANSKEADETADTLKKAETLETAETVVELPDSEEVAAEAALDPVAEPAADKAPATDETPATGKTAVADKAAATDDAYKWLYTLQTEQSGFIIGLIAMPQSKSRSGDNIGAFIHVPYDMEITDEELRGAVKEVGCQIASDYGFKEEEINKITDKKYKNYDDPFINPARDNEFMKKDGEKTAVVCYSAPEKFLSIVGHNMYWSKYFTYGMVVFAERGMWPVLPQGFEFIVKPEPGARCKIDGVEATKQGKFDVTVCGVELKRLAYVPLGSLLQITYRKERYEPVQKKVTVKDVKLMLPVPDKDELRIIYKVPVNQIEVRDSKDKARIKEAKVLINDNLPVDDSWELNTDKFTLTVDARGYEPYKKELTRMDVEKNRRIPVSLKRKDYSYKFKVRLKNDDYEGEHEIEINTDRELTTSPLRGHELKNSAVPSPNEINVLHYTADKKHRTALLKTSAVSFLVGVLAMLAIWFFWLRKEPEAVVEEPAAETEWSDSYPNNAATVDTTFDTTAQDTTETPRDTAETFWY